MLTEEENNQLFELYSKLYTKAFPQGGSLDRNDFEMATFGLSKNAEEFKKIGLGLKVVSEYTTEKNHTLVGHSGKILFNLPWQFMPEHKHTDIEILPKGSDVPAGYQKVSERINNFFGIYEYNKDGSIKELDGEPVCKFKDSEYTIIMPINDNFKSDFQSEFHFEGKSETFKLVGGDAVLFSDDAVVLRSSADPSDVPDEFQSIINEIRSTQKITTKNLIYMAEGAEVLLPKHVKHALVGGSEGAVYIEFSTPSIDEADMFIDERIIR